MNYTRPRRTPCIDRHIKRSTRTRVVVRSQHTNRTNMRIPRANTNFTSVPKDHRPRSDGNAVTPDATVASMSVQSAPPKPLHRSTRSRQNRHTIARRRCCYLPPDSRHRRAFIRCWPNREEGPVSSSRSRAAATSAPPTTHRPSRSTHAQRHGTRPNPDAAKLPPPSGEVEADEGDSCTKIQSRHLHCPMEAN